MIGSISVENVSKVYQLGETRPGLRAALTGFGRKLLFREAAKPSADYQALRDVSFTVNQGEVLGLIGPNGAGKSTLLKLLCRVTHPTTGRIQTHGRVSALIELGAGFHPDLTGRENIYLNAAILGLPKKAVDQKLDRIVEFSGLKDFIDTPVKRYSSGMYIRLGFSVAAHVEPEILLVDEVLSVGDAIFRQQCAKRIQELRAMGTTILFVSHNLYLVQSICDSAICLWNGQIEKQGDVLAVIDTYESLMRQTLSRTHVTGSGESNSDSGVEILQVETQKLGDAAGTALKHSDALEIRVHYKASQPLANPKLYIKIVDANGATCCMARSNDYDHVYEDLVGEGQLSVTLNPLQLTPGIYAVDAEILGTLDDVALAEKYSPWFEVSGSTVGHEGMFVPNVIDFGASKF